MSPPARRAGGGSDWRFDTRVVRAGKEPDPSPGVPTSTPIVASSAFQQPGGAAAIDGVFAGEAAGYVYGRYHNPTVAALERAVADLEGADATLAYASGMAAIAGAFAALDLPADAVVVAARDLYGTTITWLEAEAARCGWQIRYVDFADQAATAAAIGAPGVAAVYCETLSNPLVRVADLPALAQACGAAGVPMIVDATFTPPCLLRPIEHGVTLVAHSATKYLGGHGDVIAGVLSGPAELIDVAAGRRTLDGAIMDPFSAWLVLRGLRTLTLRVERQCRNAARIAAHLEERAGVAAVFYPRITGGEGGGKADEGLLDELFPHHLYGAMGAFEIADATADTPRRFLDALTLWGTATTLGDLESLVLIPAMTSHRKLGAERRAAMGITDGLVRLSVGIEDVDDLIADLDAALEACR